ncbi:MAG: hypothetical protein ACPHL6_12300 [Rubripirellula sp.]
MSHPASHYSLLLLLIAGCVVVGCSDRERTPHLVFEQMEEIPPSLAEPGVDSGEKKTLESDAKSDARHLPRGEIDQ